MCLGASQRDFPAHILLELPKLLGSDSSLSLNLNQTVGSVRLKRSEVMEDFETIFGISVTVVLVCCFCCFGHCCHLKYHHIFHVKSSGAKKYIFATFQPGIS